MRSLRCGQSVGSVRKLSIFDQTMFDQSWLTPSCDVPYSAVSDRIKLVTTPSTASSGSGPARPVSSSLM
jgi:hypothetical protein